VLGKDFMKTQIVNAGKNTQISVTEDTQFVLSFADLTDEAYYDVTLNFEKPGVSAELLGVYNLVEGDVLNLTTSTVHKVPNTSCNTDIKGVLADGAKSFYVGKIIIKKPAQQTSSFLSDNVLVIGENTKNRADPILEIEADDVKASHGATTGRIDKMQLYYLQSRGLSYEEAQKLLITGFFESLLVRIHDDGIKAQVKNWITQKSV
jgi:Fe-S cluster assembly protein SufD